MELHREQLTPLQAVLEPRMLERDYAAALGRLHEAFERYHHMVGLEAELARKFYQSSELDPEITILDVGCGAGSAIEELTRGLPAFMRDEHYFRLRIKGIGIDLNPLPHRISREILKVNPQTGEKGKRVSPKLRADIHVDDAMTLGTIPDASVDILYASNCLGYLPDPLRAIETGWRVLKPDGLMLWWTGLESFISPTMDEILRRTPSARELFRTKASNIDIFRDDFSPDTLIGRKKPDVPFDGFPYTLVDAVNWTFKDRKEKPEDFAVRCTYQYDESRAKLGT